MTYARPQIDSYAHPEGFITDYLPHSVRSRDIIGDARNINIQIGNLPDIATVTFSIEFINLNDSKNQKFTLETRASVLMTLSQSTPGFVHTFPIERTVDHYLILTYQQREPHLTGEFVHIKYKG